MEALSPKQRQIYDYIVSFFGLHGYSPSVREVREYVGLKSPSTIHFHLKGLEAVGLIAKAKRKIRVITISGPHSGTPEPAEEEPDQVPIVGSVTAGAPILAQECIEDHLALNIEGLTGKHFVLRIWGEPMRHAGILPDNLVMVHQQQNARSGEIVAALFEDKATVKTLHRRDGHTWLILESPDYESIDSDGCTILGKVVAVVRRYWG